MSGNFRERHGLIDLPIIRNRRERHKMAVVRPGDNEQDEEQLEEYDGGKDNRGEVEEEDDDGGDEKGGRGAPKAGKAALTEWRVVRTWTIGGKGKGKGQGETYTLLEVLLHTGRTHQIRVHLASTQHPIVGDALYTRKAARQRHGASQLQLLARQLTIAHPKSGKVLSFEAPYPAHMVDFIQSLDERARRDSDEEL